MSQNFNPQQPDLVWCCRHRAAGLCTVYFYLLWQPHLRGDFAAWNNKPVITGFVPGDTLGNLLFAVHVLLGGVITLVGLLQVVTYTRQLAPGLHRWNGRLFLALGFSSHRWCVENSVSRLDLVWRLDPWRLIGAAVILLCCALAFIVRANTG